MHKSNAKMPQFVTLGSELIRINRRDHLAPKEIVDLILEKDIK